MAKADLLEYLRTKQPPLIGTGSNKEPKGNIDDNGESAPVSDYERFDAVTTAAEALSALMSRSPPLTHDQIAEAMVEYNK